MPDASSKSSNTALAILTAAYVLCYVDRTIVTLMVGPTRTDLGLNDTQFSLLGGLAFTLLYCTLGITFGWWADRGDRSRIVAIGIAVWSTMTMLCGLARSFGMLFFARVGVGVGEATLSPAAYSLIAEIYPRNQVGRALSIYVTAVYLGIGITFAFGGWLVETLTALPPFDLGRFGLLAGWQQVFLLVGLPGLIIAPFAYFLLPESRRTGRILSPPQSPPIRPWLEQHKSFLYLHFFGFSMLTLVFNGYLSWEAEFLLREFGMRKTDGGLAIGLIILVFGPIGMLAGGHTADHMRKSGDMSGTMASAAWASILLMPFAVFAPLMPSALLSLAAFAPIIFLAAFAFGNAIAGLQMATPSPLRARVSVIYLLVVNIVGIGFAGTMVAALSDYFLGGGGARLGDAMSIVGAIAGTLAILLLRGASKQMPIDAD